MDVSELLIELYGRIPPLARSIVEGLDADQLAESPDPGANNIGWLIWHLARVQDDHVAAIRGVEQVWTTGTWAGRFDLAPDPSNIGYGHTVEKALAVHPEGRGVLVEYLETVHDRTVAWLAALGATELDRIVDDGWDPPVTMGVRLVSVADDCLQHLGQAAYLRGLMGV
jgi:hypothetical protein